VLKLNRLGIVLRPDDDQPRTVAKFNAGMTLVSDVVHRVYRYTEWRSEFDLRSNRTTQWTRRAMPG
jgi:hypothetical protein